MIKLNSKSLINYYGEIPNNYNICFVHCNIDVIDDSKEESERILNDLINIKNNISKELFKVYFSSLEDLKILVNNTNILDILFNDIYIRIRNNNELEELNKIINNKNIKIITDLKNIDNLNITNNLDLIPQVDTISELSYDKLLELNKKYNINKVCLGQISYLSNYFIDYLRESGDYFNVPKINGEYDYFNIEKEVSLSNDIYDISEYKKIEDKLKEYLIDIKEEDDLITKLYKVYKKIITSIKYNYDGLKNDELNNQNLIGGLFYNTCVCEGYSKIVTQAFSLLDVKTIVVGGGGAKEDGGHLWNQVQIGNTWYNVDATCDSINIQDGKEICNFLTENGLYESDSIIANKCESYKFKR